MAVETLVPGDPAYPAAVTGLTVSTHPATGSPAAVLRATDSATAAEAVRWARERGLRLRVRSGGHHLGLPDPGAGAAVIDLSAVKAFHHDPATGVAWCGTGLTSLEAARQLRRVGRAFPVGHAATVGVGGFLLAGGHGWNPDGWGLAATRLVALELITVDGVAVVVDDTRHPEVLAVARGAGPFFGGIVSRFAVRTLPAPELITRQWWRFPGSDAATVGDVLDRARPRLAPEVEVTCFVHRRNGPVELEVVTTTFRAAGQGLGEFLEPLDPLAGTARGTGRSETGDLADLLAGLDPHRGEAMVSDHTWSTACYTDVLPPLVVAAAESPTRLGSVLVSTAPRTDDGAARVSGDRPGWIGVAAYGHWLPGGEGCDGTEGPHRAWARDTVDRVPDRAGSYVGEADLGRDGAVERCFTPARWDLLRRVATRSTREGLFVAER